jgi:hypothetical protein
MAIVSTGCTYDFAGRKRKKVKPKGEVYKKFKVNPRTRAEYVAPTTYRRDAGVEYKSAEVQSCNTAKADTNVYSGEQRLLGISTLHKSCLQPVFDKQTAIDNARMRRN